MKLKGKIAIITGAGRGLGKASAMEMAMQGASLIILSRTLSELKQTADEIKALGATVISIKTDVSKSKDIEKVVSLSLSYFGRIDILMNNAAIIVPIKPLFRLEEREWQRILDINLTAVLLFSKAVIPHMMKQGGGKIINVTSGLGEMVMPLFGAYSITKAGLIHLTKIMAEELKEYNIQVNGLDPGVMDTRMQEDLRGLGPEILGEKAYRDFLAMKQMGQLKSPEKVARLALFLASEESDSINGEIGTETFYKKIGYRG